MNAIRTRLILIFLAATLAPLGVTLWVTKALLEHSLSYSSTHELDQLSNTLQQFGRNFYRREQALLDADVRAGRLSPERFPPASRPSWPPAVAEFAASEEPSRFALSGDRLDYFTRSGSTVLLYHRSLSPVDMDRLSQAYNRARRSVDSASSRDLRRGFLSVYLLLAAIIWAGSLALLVYLASRISRPIGHLTTALGELAGGRHQTRVQAEGTGEVATALIAFNHMAEQIEHNQRRLVYLTRVASWQALARKMAHEVKNSLTPIRLIMEEVIARRPDVDRAFLEQAAQIVVDEVNSLERRVRAFSEFSAEPGVHPVPLDLNALLEERILLLGSAHPEVRYEVRPSPETPLALADADLIRGVLTNLLENAAQAVGSGGSVLGRTFRHNGHAGVEIHDSGPGLTPQARQTIFEPVISFKKGGMGLGLSIAYKSVLLCGGEITLVEGVLGGAGFRVSLPSVKSS
jgi:nitrogen fixation/metabolism regulation signal transduction histidine kinase